MKYFDCYKHLNKDPISSPFNIEQIAEWVVKQNYGTHRMVCALVRKQKRKNSNGKLSSALRNVVDKYTT